MKRACVLLMAILFSYAYAAAEEAGESRPYVLIDYAREVDETVVKQYPGHILTKSSVELLVRVPGELWQIEFEEGDTVSENQTLYRLDPVKYEAEVMRAKAEVSQCEAQLTFTEVSYERTKRLYEQKAGTKEELDRVESEHLAAEAALLAATARLISAEDDLKNTIIQAPISGKIGQTKYTVGNYLTPESGVLATINQLDPLRVTFAMANKDFLDMFGSEEALKEDATIRLRLANGTVYQEEGSISFLDNEANMKTDAIRVFAIFNNTAGTLVPGSAATVLLERRSGRKTAAVTPSAVMYDSQSPFVYVLDGNYEVARRDIAIGPEVSGMRGIQTGVSPGEMVIVDGMNKAIPGERVNPVFAEPGTSLSSSNVNDGPRTSRSR